ncbi:Six-hairpin glycosidase-like protein [Dipodascopsis uninucleata]
MYLPAETHVFEDADFEHWLDVESAYSFNGILANIGPDGAMVASKGVRAGVVVASPSHKNPNYFYQWVRDGAITMRALVDAYASTRNDSLRDILMAYVDDTHHVQRTENPSGAFESGGLGEPKYEVDGTPFMDSWGRPQRDGPALRAITITEFVRVDAELSGKDIKDYKNIYSSIIKPDLEYVSKSWASPGFDLWEEVNGLHFFTALVQHRALSVGGQLALSMGDAGAAEWYRIQEHAISRLLNAFWDEERCHLVETLASSRSGLDAALLLGSIHGGSESLFPTYSEEIVASLDALVKDMRTRHPINVALPENENGLPVAVGIGRYPEDVYSGGDEQSTSDGNDIGNPWFLCTSTVAHTIYDLVNYISSSDEPFVITNVTAGFYLPFLLSIDDLFEDSLIKAAAHKYKDASMVLFSFPKDSKTVDTLLKQLIAYADGFMRIIRAHTDSEGNLSEQFDRNTGYMRGAPRLTWSFESFWNANKSRSEALKAYKNRAK